MDYLLDVDTAREAQLHRLPLEEIILNAKARKSIYVGELYRRVRDDLFISLFASAPDVAWDAVSSVFMKLPTHLDSFEDYTDRERFLRWIRVLVWNRARTLVRSERRRRDDPMPDGFDVSQGTPMRTIEADMLRERLIQVLTPADRDFFLEYEAGVEVADQAARYNKLPNAIHQWRHRVKQTLQKEALRLLAAPQAWTVSPARERKLKRVS